MQEYRGIAASPGIAIGPVFNYVKQDLKGMIQRDLSGDRDAEKATIERAMKTALDDINGLIELMEEKERFEEVEIFSIQIEFLEDPSYGEEIRRLVEEEAYRAGHAVEVVSDQLTAEFSEIEDEYFRNRIADIQDLARRLLAAIFNVKDMDLGDISVPSIIVADDLTPTDTAHLSPENAIGICTQLGSATSHTAILSRGLGIPAVVGAGSLGFADGSRLILDGAEGVLILNPDDSTVTEYSERGEKYREYQQTLLAEAHDPAVSTDGKHIEVVANIGMLCDVHQGLEKGAEGVGLFRTEFLFLERSTLPDEELQYTEYREIFEALEDRPIVVRTLDIGGDKQLPSIDMPVEQNPFLGERAVRLAMSNRDTLLYPQLRAILRAGVGKDLRIMFPMIADVGEFLHLKEEIASLMADLKKEGLEFNEKPQLGIMIEIPSAAIAADLFAPHVDFFSIGTNDLTQYTMAVDRTNERVANLADYFQPAVVRLVSMVIEAAHAQGKWVGMCGEMAGDVKALPLLMALGLDEFSMAPGSVPEIKYRARRMSVADLSAKKGEFLSARSAGEIRKLSTDLLTV